MTKYKTQEQLVVEYIDQHKGITSKEAYECLGISQLGTRIYNLKRMGFVFSKTKERGRSKTGRKCSYDRYFIIQGGTINGITNNNR